MKDKLDEVLESYLSKRIPKSPSSGPFIELISFNKFDKSKIASIRQFQAAVAEQLDVRLVVEDGGYGCFKIIIRAEAEADSIDDARDFIRGLLENEVFRNEALKGGFSLAIVRDPDARMDLKSGLIDSLYQQGLRVFCSYAHEDEDYKIELEKHLSLLKRQGYIQLWHDRDINAGDEWKTKIDLNLESADIILLLVSADFIASDYCYSVEMERALTRHEEAAARVIPIIVRQTDWQTAPFGKLQVLPRDGKPVKTWEDRDEAWTEVAKEIRKIVKRARDSSTSPVEESFLVKASD
jgi:hypothetical protein